MPNTLKLFLLILLGTAAGAVITMYSVDDTGPAENKPVNTIQVLSGENDRIAELETELATLKARIEALEVSSSAVVSQDLTSTGGEEVTASQILGTNPAANASQALNILDGLVAAGIDPYTADEIVRAENSNQLKQLELRDSAIREGYIGTGRFREEMQKLRADQFGVRDRIDEATYDRYLYHTGQPNRILVDSVILGSAAENVGMMPGDVILSYENQRLHNWNDLRGATSGGERGELVSVTVSRNGTELNMTIPRGPLGVRLNSIRLDPDGE